MKISENYGAIILVPYEWINRGCRREGIILGDFSEKHEKHEKWGFLGFLTLFGTSVRVDIVGILGVKKTRVFFFLRKCLPYLRYTPVLQVN